MSKDGNSLNFLFYPAINIYIYILFFSNIYFYTILRKYACFSNLSIYIGATRATQI